MSIAQLSQDHQETLQKLADLGRLLSSLPSEEGFQQILHCSETLIAELKQHFVMEEQALFPMLSMTRPMILMTVEHETLLGLMSDYHNALLHPDPQSLAQWERIQTQFQALRTRLEAHILEEDRGIFPLAHSVFEPEEHQRLARLMATLQSQSNSDPAVVNTLLERPAPAYQVYPQLPPPSSNAPIQYQPLFLFGHHEIQRLVIQAGKTLAPHWSAQAQWIYLLSGCCSLTFAVTPEYDAQAGNETVTLQADGAVQLTPRCWMALQAEEDSALLIVKLWPHPNYAKS